jgi:hypothetical protein
VRVRKRTHVLGDFLVVRGGDFRAGGWRSWALGHLVFYTVGGRSVGEKNGVLLGSQSHSWDCFCCNKVLC